MSKKKIKNTTTPEQNHPSGNSVLPAGYAELLVELKTRVRSAQLKAAVTVNTEMIQLYWDIGRMILRQQHEQGWGAKIIDRLGEDLQKEFPGQAGYSARNLKYMRAFADAWPDLAIVQQAAAQIPWFHNVTIIEQVKQPEARIWYAKAAKEHG